MKPEHYAGLEPIDVIESWDLGFNLGNAIKYIGRFRFTHNIADLEKAENYLHRHRTGEWLES